MSNKTVFSLNKEDWEFDWSTFIDEVYDSMEEGEDIIGTTYYEGEAVEIPMSRIFNVDHFIDNLSEKAYDECGEDLQDPWIDLTPDQKKELESLVIGFLEKHCPLNMYDVENVKEKKFTEEDV